VEYRLYAKYVMSPSDAVNLESPLGANRTAKNEHKVQ